MHITSLLQEKKNCKRKIPVLNRYFTCFYEFGITKFKTKRVLLLRYMGSDFD